MQKPLGRLKWYKDVPSEGRPDLSYLETLMVVDAPQEKVERLGFDAERPSGG